MAEYIDKNRFLVDMAENMFTDKTFHEIVQEQPTADVIEREKIDKAIEEILLEHNHSVLSGKSKEYYNGVAKALDILKKRIEEEDKITNSNICACYYCKHFETEGWSSCKIHEGAYGDSRCNDYVVRENNQ